MSLKTALHQMGPHPRSVQDLLSYQSRNPVHDNDDDDGLRSGDDEMDERVPNLW